MERSTLTVVSQESGSFFLPKWAIQLVNDRYHSSSNKLVAKVLSVVMRTGTRSQRSVVCQSVDKTNHQTKPILEEIIWAPSTPKQSMHILADGCICVYVLQRCLSVRKTCKPCADTSCG
eukprot:810439-Amphidinium_carterae.1